MRGISLEELTDTKLNNDKAGIIRLLSEKKRILTLEKYASTKIGSANYTEEEKLRNILNP